jgi:hypothetical protein
MISPPPSILSLSSEDVSEYEAIKKKWPKRAPKATGKKSETAPDPNELHKREVQERIGLVPKK